MRSNNEATRGLHNVQQSKFCAEIATCAIIFGSINTSRTCVYLTVIKIHSIGCFIERRVHIRNSHGSHGISMAMEISKLVSWDGNGLMGMAGNENFTFSRFPAHS